MAIGGKSGLGLSTCAAYKMIFPHKDCGRDQSLEGWSETLENWWKSPANPSKRHNKNMKDRGELPEMCDLGGDLSRGEVFLRPQCIERLGAQVGGAGV